MIPSNLIFSSLSITRNPYFLFIIFFLFLLLFSSSEKKISLSRIAFSPLKVRVRIFSLLSQGCVLLSRTTWTSPIHLISTVSLYSISSIISLSIIENCSSFFLYFNKPFFSFLLTFFRSYDSTTPHLISQNTPFIFYLQNYFVDMFTSYI